MNRFIYFLFAAVMTLAFRIGFAAESPSFALSVQTPNTPDIASMPIAAKAGNVTIVVKHRPGLFGQGAVRYAIDRGSGVVRDAVVVERLAFPDGVGNFCIPRNVVYFSSTRSVGLTGERSEPRQPALLIGGRLRADLEVNAALIGKFDSRGILVWTRPPGRMRLELVNLNGNQSVCAPVEVEAGKTYEVTIHYGDHTEFVVAMLSDFKSGLPEVIDSVNRPHAKQ